MTEHGPGPYILATGAAIILLGFGALLFCCVADIIERAKKRRAARDTFQQKEVPK